MTSKNVLRASIEDCFNRVENRFRLVLIAAHRARQISSGLPSFLDRKNDKNSILALREIAEDKLDVNEIFNSLVKNHRLYVQMDEKDQELEELLDIDSHEE